MDKQTFMTLISDRMKLIRVEQGYTQNQMAEILGISKKTLVQIEKRRTVATWTTVTALCALFAKSELLTSLIGDDPVEFVQLVAHQNIRTPKEKTMGGKVWWKQIKATGNFRLQQNLVSQHFRILDQADYRWHSTFDQTEAVNYLKHLKEVEKSR